VYGRPVLLRSLDTTSVLVSESSTIIQWRLGTSIKVCESLCVEKVQQVVMLRMLQLGDNKVSHLVSSAFCTGRVYVGVIA